MTRKRLPIGIQTFRKIREKDFYYVDKTRFILQLIEGGTHYFLSRPRRFGKSLLLDTIAELFAGNEALFRGLYVHERWDWKRSAPVLRISFGGGMVQDAAGLREKCWEQLRINQAEHGLSCSETGIGGCFAELIRGLHAARGERVVVLIDEYDKPILDNLTRPEIARACRDGLRDLYSVIKDSDAHIRFAMLTGVSKFSKVSLFSGLNNLNDITVDPQYSAICGYTEQDLDRVFAPELDGLDRDRIRSWYNGYNWTGEAVYNPFDVLLLFDKRQFRPWWFETGTPRFLVDVLTERHTDLPRLEHLHTSEQLLSAFDVERISTEALLWQTGYLTIDSVEQAAAFVQYRLRYPNVEVRAALNAALLDRLGGGSSEIPRQTVELHKLLLANDFAGMEALFTAFFASIPHDWYRNNSISQYEGYYASVFYAYFASLGLDLIPEESSNAGRLDMALRFNGQVYLFEFKVVELAGDGAALQQIKDRGYADKYQGQGVPTHLVGVEFSRERRAVVGFEVESIAAAA